MTPPHAAHLRAGLVPRIGSGGRLGAPSYCRSPNPIGSAALRSTSTGSAGSTPGSRFVRVFLYSEWTQSEIRGCARLTICSVRSHESKEKLWM
jgi:hypothetical protein